MLQILDYFRRLYFQETGRKAAHDLAPDAYIPGVMSCLTTPTWEYVCWLEGRPSQYEKEPLPASVTTTTGLDEPYVLDSGPPQKRELSGLKIYKEIK